MPELPITPVDTNAKIAKRIARLACNTVSTVIILLLLVLVLLLYVPKLLGYEEFNVLSGSMLPDYPVGSMVFVKQVPPEELRIGDVVSYYIKGSTTVATHRVVEIDLNTKQLITKGDMNELNDAPVSFDALIGRVNFKLPFLGELALWLKTKEGLTTVCVLFAIAALMIVVSDLLSDRKKRRKTQN